MVLLQDTEDKDHDLHHFTHRSLPPPSSHRLEPYQHKVYSRLHQLQLHQQYNNRTKPKRPDQVLTKDETDIYLKSDQSLIDN